MSQYSKVFPFIELQKRIELLGGNKIVIQRTKQEPLFESFNDSQSTPQRLVREIGENPILRQFLFLKSLPKYSAESPTGAFITYPICFDPAFDFEKSMERDDYKNQDQKLNTRLEKSTKIIVDILGSYFNDTMNKIIETPEALKLIKGRTPFIESFKNINSIMKKDTKIMESFASKTFTFMSSAYEAQSLERILNFKKLASPANKNSKSLDASLKLPDEYQQLHDSFSKLAKYVFLKTESLCLDCYYIHNEMPFYSITVGGKEIDLVRQCHQCRGSGIVHNIQIGYPSGVSKLLMPDSNWLYELILGYSVAALDFVKEVYIHKKIHSIKEGNIGKGIESDVTLVTDENKLILIEVTTQSDTDNIMNAIASKAKHLEESGIPYEKMLYFTSSNMPTFMTMDAFRTRVFGLRHLYNLTHFVKEWLAPERTAENEISAPKSSL